MPSPLAKLWSLADLMRHDGPVEGSLFVSDCPRLQGLHQGADDAQISVAAQLRPSPSELTGGEPQLSCTAAVTLKMTCQRCLEACSLKIDCQFTVVFVNDAGDRDDNEAFDFWELHGDTLRLADVIEEYLLLELPLAPMHADGQCSLLPGLVRTAVAEEGQKRQTPFAGLAEAMRRPAEND